MTSRKWMRHIPLLMYLLLFCVVVLNLVVLQPVVAEKNGKSHSRLVAFADLHGDVYNCRLLLQAANITDTDDHWIAGSATVVQLGDIADRGRHSHEIYDLFESLEIQAAEAGGEFIFLVGNHELMNLLGEYSYVHKDMMTVFGGKDQYAAAFSPTGAYGSFILQHHVVLVRGGVVFTHGGITPFYAVKGVDGINAAFHDGFNCHTQQNSNTNNINMNNTNMNNKNNNVSPYACHPFRAADSPVWSRQLVYDAQKGDCGLLTESLRLLSAAEQAAGRPPVHSMAVGHTIQPGGGVQLLCGGRLIAADVGLSRYAWSGGGHLAFVEFPPPQRRAAPQYPYGRGVRPAVGDPRTQKIHPPRRVQSLREKEREKEKEKVQDEEELPPPPPPPPPEEPEQEQERREVVLQKPPAAVDAPSPLMDVGVEAPHTRLVDYVFLFFLLAIVGSLFVLKTWKSLLRNFRVNLKET